MSASDGSYSHPYEPRVMPTRPDREEFGSRTGLSDLPGIPDADDGIKPLHHEESDFDAEDAYVEFDLSGMSDSPRKYTNLVQPSLECIERIIGSPPKGARSVPAHLDGFPPGEASSVPKYLEGSPLRGRRSLDTNSAIQTDTPTSSAIPSFFDEPNWKEMKVVADTDYYNERGELEIPAAPDIINNDTSHGYTRVDTEEQVAKYLELDKKTDFLFRALDSIPQSEWPSYRPEDIEYSEKRPATTENLDDDSDFDDELSMMDSKGTLQTTKDMLLEGQKFAYVAGVKLISIEMATELAKLTQFTSRKVAKTMSAGQRNFSNWTMYITLKLYDHMNLTTEERSMIENLSKHGLEANDLTRSLFSNTIDTKENREAKVRTPGFDLKWVIICDLFLLLLSDGYYDSRSNTLLLIFAKSAGISSLEVLQFQRRLIDNLQLEVTEKSIENKDEMLDDRQYIDKHRRKNKRKRMMFIGLATVGGSLAIGLSAGLLAPVIGAGIAAGLTTVGITGTAGFLAGVGGSAIITTGGVVVGAKVGSRAGANRTGEVETFEFKPLHNNKRTNLIITISGWMNGHHDDVRLPFSTVDPVMGDMFSLLWEPEMLQSMGQTINILATEALAASIQQILGATILTALMLALQLPMILSKLSYLLDNPWNVSLDRAWKAGIILADTLVLGNMGVRPITLVGFSLGARLIYSCLIQLANRGAFGLIEHVILLGTPVVVKPDQMALARLVVSGNFVNGYSKKDWILGYLFRATGGGLQTVAGLSPIENVYGVRNIDCTEWVDGHMAYRKAIPKILLALDWEVLSEEFTEIEEPDVEQGKRARQLVSEFDEARAKMESENEQAQSAKPKWKKWFTPKPKDWWDIAGKSADHKEPGKPGSNVTLTAEYDEFAEGAAAPEPIFDVAALQEQIQDIADLAGKDDATLEKARADTESSLGNLHLNEDAGDDLDKKTFTENLASKLRFEKSA